MLAGLGPVPAVMFVVAADGGWMPQSAEHLAAVDALGVRHGLLVITRSDLADPDPATRQALAEIARTSLGSVEAVAVSAVTGAGLDDLRAALARLAAALRRPRNPGRASGAAVDRPVVHDQGRWHGRHRHAARRHRQRTARNCCSPAVRPQPVRVRGLQALGEPAERVTGVARVALNLRGVAADLPRAAWRSSSRAAGRSPPNSTSASRPARPARSRSSRRNSCCTSGSARTQARVRLLGEDSGAVYARLRLRDPLPLHAGDRVMLRDPGAAGPGDLRCDRARPVPAAARPPRRGAAAVRELATWPDPPAAADLLRRHKLLRAATLAAHGRHRTAAARSRGTGSPTRRTGPGCAPNCPRRGRRLLRQGRRWLPACPPRPPAPRWTCQAATWWPP